MKWATYIWGVGVSSAYLSTAIHSREGMKEVKLVVKCQLVGFFVGLSESERIAMFLNYVSNQRLTVIQQVLMS